MKRLKDPLVMPGSNQTPEERLGICTPLQNTDGQRYIEKRGISIDVAHEAGVRYDSDWNGRPAVVAPMVNAKSQICSLHGRYLNTIGKQNKMLTIGPGGGIFHVGATWNINPIILVEGLFDALSLATCGYSAIATVGRLAPFLPEVCRDHIVILAFDGNRPGESEVTFYKDFLTQSRCYRITPPGRCKDWNTALIRQGKHGIHHWLKKNGKDTFDYHG